jgi:hypothetical protein
VSGGTVGGTGLWVRVRHVSCLLVVGIHWFNSNAFLNWINFF